MRKIIGIIFVAILLIACTNKRTPYDILFNKFDSTFSKNEKQIIKECESISCLSSFIKQDRFKRLSEVFNTLPDSIKFSVWSSVKDCGLLNGQLAFLYVYQKKLNNEEISFTKIIKELKHYGDSLDNYVDMEMKKDVEIKSALAKNNYDKYKKGDTLNLQYPLEKTTYNKTVVFYSYYNKSNFTDTLFLKCVLLAKRMEEIKGFDLAHNEYYFLVRMLEVKNKDIDLISNHYRKGYTDELSLYYYGRSL